MYVGQALRRREDVRFLAGDGKFVDDIAAPAGAALAFLRSPHAHARIRGIDTRRARAIPGVLRIVTAADWAAAGLGKLVCVHPMPFGDGRPMNEALRPAFASGKVRHVGDVVAAVVAENRYIALDAADAIAVDYEPLPAVADTAAALDARRAAPARGARHQSRQREPARRCRGGQGRVCAGGACHGIDIGQQPRRRQSLGAALLSSPSI